jgi:hypothetical protein
MDVLLTPARFLHQISIEILIHRPAVFHADYGRVHSPAVDHHRWDARAEIGDSIEDFQRPSVRCDTKPVHPFGEFEADHAVERGVKISSGGLNGVNYYG